MFKKVLIALSIILVIALAGFVIWGSTPSAPTAEALAAAASGNGVLVETVNGWMVFRPGGSQPTTGLIFYPGGHVDYRSYALPLREIARQGFLVVVPPMPLSLAIFGINKADEVISAFPGISAWAVGGHSLGGSMAAQYASGSQSKLKGLVFWASYPAGSLKNRTDLKVLSVSGSLDGLSTPAKINDSRLNLPDSTVFVAIQGGNHAQFGSYGEQSGDNSPSISPQEQWKQAGQATLGLLKSIEGK